MSKLRGTPLVLSDDALAFLAERHLATLTTLRGDGSPHVVAVGFTFDIDRSVVRVIASGASVKVGNAARGGRAAVSQVEGRRWITLEGTVRVSANSVEVADAVSAYARRYQEPGTRPDRVVVEIAIDRMLGSTTMRATP